MATAKRRRARPIARTSARKGRRVLRTRSAADAARTVEMRTPSDAELLAALERSRQRNPRRRRLRYVRGASNVKRRLTRLTIRHLTRSQLYLRAGRGDKAAAKELQRRNKAVGVGSTTGALRNPGRRRKGRISMARRRKGGRTAKQRAAFRKMIAGLRRYKKSHGRARRASNPHRKRRRRRNPSVAITRTKGTSTMARRRRRRRRPATIIRVSNPRRHRRRRRNPGRRHHHRRRRNPGMGGRVGGALKFTLATAVPAVAAGAVASFVDAKFLADKSQPVQIGGKLALGLAAAVALRSRPVTAAAIMGGIFGNIGSSLVARLNGGVQTASAQQTMKAMGLLIREDPYARRAMSALIDSAGRPMNAPSLHGMGGTAVPDYPVGLDVNLG